MGDVIEQIKARFTKPVAVLTNSSLMHDPQVRIELGLADLVVAKLDAPNEKIFRQINRPTNGVTLSLVLNGIKRFNQEYPGKLALQIMFVSSNQAFAADLAKLAKEINPLEVQINTPLRPSPVSPLALGELTKIKKLFKPLKAYSVYDVKKPDTLPLDAAETRRRRPEA